MTAFIEDEARPQHWRRALIDMPGFRVKARDHADVDVRRDERGTPYLRQGDAIIYLSDTTAPLVAEALERLVRSERAPVIRLPLRAMPSDLVAQAET